MKLPDLPDSQSWVVTFPSAPKYRVTLRSGYVSVRVRVENPSSWWFRHVMARLMQLWLWFKIIAAPLSRAERSFRRDERDTYRREINSRFLATYHDRPRAGR